MTEIWKSIPGYEGLYEASSLGRIRSIDRAVPTFSARAGRSATQRRKGRIIVQNAGPHGYMLVCLSKNGIAKTKRVNVLVCSAFHGARPDGLQACHNDGNKQHNKEGNLRWDTATANQADRIGHGTALRGEAIGTAKLTLNDVAAIRASASFATLTGVDVSRTHYHRIKRGQAWAL